MALRLQRGKNAPDLTSALKNEAATLGRFDLRRALVVIQIAISLLLLIGAGLFVRSLRNLRSLDPGFLRESVLLVNVDPEQSDIKGSGSVSSMSGCWNARAVFRALRADQPGRRPRRLMAPNGTILLPSGVIDGNQTKSQTLTSTRSVRDISKQRSIPISRHDLPGPRQSSRIADLLPHADRDKDKLGPPPPVAIIRQSHAPEFFPHESPIGRHFSRGDKLDSR